ncbi:PREDICTED: carnitine O-acetyltransferase-like isoform X1 [Nicrophorus vespilloides]|uniref:Carnitine O-acetyltransferase-like isoform X1 n=2 Tax=Nicrophorus vespilloides TaxID=110193 RepID=A0ABM1M5M2_NICVS|nr:PREDICTED: carnitine O-acetyltransferase-like isoform X1 [Nicrophorus vespilloides]
MYQSTLRAVTGQRIKQNLSIYLKGASMVKSNTMTVKNMATKALPRLPVPTLDQTLYKYLESVRPLLSNEEFAKTLELTEKFANTDGAKLQALLLEKAHEAENWLADWWLNAAYLDFRSPLVVWSSPGQLMPFTHFKDIHDRLLYIANVIEATIEYKKLIDDDKIPVDMMGKEPLDMQQYKKVFGTCRNPALPRDVQEFNPQSNHIIVAHRNHFFKVNLCGKDGNKLSVNQLVSQLKYCIELSKTSAPAVGILTSDHRDNWSIAYQVLMQDETNRNSVDAIQKSLYVMSIDQAMPKIEGQNRHTEASHQLIHGGGSKVNGGNRWFDKTVQFIIGENGVNGLCYEHSPAEGVPIAVMVDFLVEYMKRDGSKGIPDADGVELPIHLEFNVNADVEKEIIKSCKNLDALAADLDMDSFSFDVYGKEFVKKHKISPDSYIQMAMQYAFYRMYNYPGAHYESAATRKYLHGRTETIRSCSTQSVAFARAMMDDAKTPEDKVKSLREAVDSHKKYTVDALNGFGVDRHLLGLKLTSLEQNISLNPFFKDVAFTKSNSFRLSTSQVATKCDAFMCYGPLVMDGYGCCYNPRSNNINFAVSSMHSNPDTRSSQFREALEHSLLDMHDILVRVQKSKL